MHRWWSLLHGIAHCWGDCAHAAGSYEALEPTFTWRSGALGSLAYLLLVHTFEVSGPLRARSASGRRHISALPAICRAAAERRLRRAPLLRSSCLHRPQ